MTILKDKAGKYSSKRLAGYAILGSAIIMTFLGGFGMYNPDASIINTMFMTGCGVLGIGVFEKSTNN